MQKVDNARGGSDERPIKIWSPRSTGMPDVVGLTLGVHHREQHIQVCVTETIVGVKLGEIAVKKLPESAIANAEHTDGADVDALKVKTIHVERGSFQKRFHARAKGRGNRVLRHSCHIYLTVGD